jgi:hypothetical protein
MDLSGFILFPKLGFVLVFVAVLLMLLKEIASPIGESRGCIVATWKH